MSYSSLFAQTQDAALQNRVTSAVQKEAYSNPELSDTEFARALKMNYANAWQVYCWPVCVITEAEYEYALNTGNEDPGGDPTVITDSDILAAVQANWPTEWPPAIPVMI